MSQAAVSIVAPSIPTVNLQDPSTFALVPKQCWNCGSHSFHRAYPDAMAGGNIVCLSCSRYVADLVDHPPRPALMPEEWMGHRGRPVGNQCPDHPYARLTHEEVQDIRRLHADGMSTPELATRYGVNRDTAYNVVVRKTWKCVE